MLQADFHRRTIELRHLRSRIRDKYVEPAKSGFDEIKHLPDFVLLGHVSLNHKTIAAALADLRERVIGGGVILYVINGNVRAAFRQLQGDPPSYAARAARDQSVFPFDCHIWPLPLSVT